MRLLAGRGQRLVEAFADRFAVVEDPAVGRSKRGFQTIRVVSAVVPKVDAPFLARVLKTPVDVELLARRLDPQGPFSFVGNVSESPMRVRVKPLEQNLVHIVGVAETAYGQEEDKALTVLVPDGDEAGAFFRRVSHARGVPMLPEWAQEVLAELRAQDLVRPFVTYGDVRGYDVLANTAKLLEVVRDRLRYGLISIPSGMSAPDVDLSSLHTLDAYMLTFGKTLGERVLTQSPARHTPGDAVQPAGVLRQLYQAQADAAAAAVKTLESDKTAWVVGEQGVGKTTIGLAAARLQIGERGRVLIHAPNHLVPKWAREARAVLGSVTVRTVRTYKDALAALPDLRGRPRGTEVWILPRDSAKLGYLWRPVAVRHVSRSGPNQGRFSHWSCPACGSPLDRTFKKKDRPPEPFQEHVFRSRGPSNAKCPRCKESLWEADRSGPRRESPSRILRRRVSPGTFDVLLADEIHEEKGDTGQGQSLGRLYAISKKAVFLTGTLLGGKSSDLYYHLARTKAGKMRAAGFEYRNPAPFVRTYGVTERRERTSKLGATTSNLAEQPGVHPAVYGDWLMGSALFLGLEDLMADLPDYQEEVVMVPMDEQQERMVQGVTDSLRSLAGAAMHSGSKGRLGTYIQAALAYPDHVWANQAIVDAQGNVLAEARGEWDASRVLPKEAQIVAYALREKARGRRSLVYCQFTGKYDVSRRLLRQFEDVGLKTAILTTDVPTEEREAWIAQRVREGVDVLICHPRLVATGLDLVEFPTILWAQTGYSLFEVRQASRRSWRLGQSEPVKVVFFAYEETAQETCLQILGDKLLAAQAVEGRFSAEGLQALSSGRNAALQLANALVYGLEGLKEVTEVWKAGQLVEAGPVVNPLEVLPSEPATDADTYQPSSLVGALVGTAPAQGSVMPSALTTLALRKPRRAKRASGQQALF